MSDDVLERMESHLSQSAGWKLAQAGETTESIRDEVGRALQREGSISLELDGQLIGTTTLLLLAAEHPPDLKAN